jgi:hypothetical protein
VFDYDVVAHTHATRSALPAVKHHQNSLMGKCFFPELK